jgi:hypothetical protein
VSPFRFSPWLPDRASLVPLALLGGIFDNFLRRDPETSGLPEEGRWFHPALTGPDLAAPDFLPISLMLDSPSAGSRDFGGMQTPWAVAGPIFAQIWRVYLRVQCTVGDLATKEAFCFGP